MLSAAAIRLIDVYQRHLSPRKGFVCAHHVLHHGPTCSGFAKSAITHHGLFMGLRLLVGRAAECAAASRILNAEPSDVGGEEKPQRSDGPIKAELCCLDGAASTACCLFQF